MAPMSTANAIVAVLPDTGEDPATMLNRYGSRATKNRRNTFDKRDLPVSIVRNDIVSVYLNQIVMRMRKLNAKNTTP